MLFINNQQELSKFCLELEKQPLIAMDTEFMRRVTYFSRLCLIQIVTPIHRCIIDPLACNNLQPLENILYNENNLKILHASREDFEIFYRFFKKVPINFFDTQIAASVVGLGSSISYQELCCNILNVKIDKKFQTADWGKRPLSNNMLDYAIKDVDYLIPLYKQLNSLVKEKNLQSELRKQMDPLHDPSLYKADLNNIWKKVNFNTRSSLLLTRMQMLAAFREECAMKENLPRKHFASDNDLIQLCTHLPHDENHLQKINLTSRLLTKSPYKERLIELCLALKEQNSE